MAKSIKRLRRGDQLSQLSHSNSPAAGSEVGGGPSPQATAADDCFEQSKPLVPVIGRPLLFKISFLAFVGWLIYLAYIAYAVLG